MSRLILPPPPSLGFPPRFTSYRPTQTEAIFDVTDSTKRVRILNAPTGIGKTLAALTILVLEQARGLILTSTKALQDFYLDVGRDVGLVDIRGAGNYRCPALEPGGVYAHLRGHRAATADNGPCLIGLPCHLKAGGCPRYDALRAATNSQLVVSNYDWWITSGKSAARRGETDEEGLGSFDYLILDELHAAESHVQKALHVDLDLNHVRTLIRRNPLSVSSSIPDWREWARAARIDVASQLDRISRDLRLAREGGDMEHGLSDDLREYRALDRTLSDLAQMKHGKWIVSETRGGLGTILSFDPVWVGEYTEEMLFRRIPVVVGMSATVVPAHLRYLGIGGDEGDAFDFFEYPSPFDIRRRPVYVWPAVRMHYGMGDGDKRKWARAIDEILLARRDRKNLILTVSYKRARELQQMSQYAGTFVMHDPKSTKDAVERWRKMKPPADFLSPSVGTGWDFPDDDARCLIEAKTPYPSLESEIMRARVESDKSYSDVYAATEVSQNLGRIVRSETDWGEGIIVDAAFGGLMGEKKFRLIAKWIRQAMRWINSAPKPMKGF